MPKISPLLLAVALGAATSTGSAQVRVNPTGVSVNAMNATTAKRMFSLWDKLKGVRNTTTAI